MFESTTLYDLSLTPDLLGRITSRTQSLLGESETRIYEYDTAGRLTTVKDEIGTVLESYTYDPNGNRTQTMKDGQTITATYDAQDRLTQYGDTTYIFADDGQLASKTDSTGTITLTYDFMGNLTQVEFPSTMRVEYLIDGKNRRIGKRLNGVLTQGLLYKDQLNPVAELDADGNITSRFVYADKGHVPAYMIKDGKTYRFITDHLGSPRLIVDTDTGEIAQRLDYDPWGKVTQDTNPGFQPFGFAGGLYDHHTGLVRFGARDYDPEIGRWTSKDPIGFDGGDSNLYGYVMQDPINLVDPEGLRDWDLISSYRAFHHGYQIDSINWGEVSREFKEAIGGDDSVGQQSHPRVQHDIAGTMEYFINDGIARSQPQYRPQLVDPRIFSVVNTAISDGAQRLSEKLASDFLAPAIGKALGRVNFILIFCDPGPGPAGDPQDMIDYYYQPPY